MQLFIRRRRRIPTEKNPKPSHKCVTRRRLTAQISHNTSNDHLLHAPLPQNLLQLSTLKSTVRVLLQNDIFAEAEIGVQIGHEFGFGSSVED
ncbi:hypothetical protein G4B88_024617 [Cannabis sativa]|uniref:Uncharacterized protein n=1 Tax=Cannabis sativa TaxID=3483 RepID=A0A7J6GVY1_CANSA|nr:hypothetical protein G4B88_024617 [Cannabis sativa]